MSSRSNNSSPGAPMDPNELPEMPLRPDGSPDLATLGRAASTADGRKNALKFFNTFQALKGKPMFEDLTDQHVANDLLPEVFYEVAHFAANCPIPTRYGPGFAPPDSNQKTMIKVPSLVQYLIGMKMCFREKFPDHSLWPPRGVETVPWFNQLSAAFVKEWRRNYQMKWKNNPDIQFGNSNVRPLFCKELAGINAQEESRLQLWHGESFLKTPSMDMPCNGVTFQAIMRRGFLSCDVNRPESWYNLSRTCTAHMKINRGGEIKNDVWEDYKYYYHYQALDTLKIQIKVLSSPLSCPLLHNPNSYALCPVFHLANYLILGDGLYRTQLQMEEGLDRYVYPNEHHYGSGAVSRRTTNAIRSYMPQWMGPEEKLQYSAKSSRKGMTMELAEHMHSNVFTVTSRTGHKTGFNIDPYFVDDTPLHGLAAARIVAGHTQFRKPMRIPSPHFLDIKFKPGFDRLIEVILARNCLKCFEPGGHMHYYLQVMVCVCLYWYNDICETDGSCAFVNGWKNLAFRAELIDPEEPSHHPEIVLNTLSSQLKCQEQSLNNGVNEVDITQLTAVELYQQVAGCADRVAELNNETYEQKQDMKACFGQVCASIVGLEAELKRAVSNMTREKEAREKCMEELRVLKAKEAHLKRPSRGTKVAPSTPEMAQMWSPRKCPPSVEVITKDEAMHGMDDPSFNSSRDSQPSVVNNVQNNSGTVYFTGSANSSQPTTLLQQQRQKPRSLQLLRTSSAPDTSGKVQLHKALEEARGHRSGNLFAGPGPLHDESKGLPDSCSGVKSCYLYTMELVDSVLDPKERRFLVSAPGAHHPNQEDRRMYDSIRNKVMDRLDELEGKPRCTKYHKGKKVASKMGGAKTTASVLAIGKRVKKLKNNINKALGANAVIENRIDKTPLCPLGDLATRFLPPGTPEGNRSMMSYMVADERASKRQRFSDHEVI